MSSICEACERSPAEIVEPCDNADEPYRLCVACHHRIHARALRPVEWYNLAKHHGWNQFLLHDDFYEESGVAAQPEEEVEHAEDFPAPTLLNVAHDPGLLLDFSMTRWHLDNDVILAWKNLPRGDVLAILTHHFAVAKNVHTRETVLEICACALREHAEKFVRYVWGDYPGNVSLHSLARVSAACLPFREGFDRTVTAIAALDGKSRRETASCLCHFHSTETLDWIERNIVEPITESWGYLAAASKLDWSRVERWYKLGRPMSLVAIDALLAIARPQSPFLRVYQPQLVQPPTRARFDKLLKEYLAKDPVPRVEQRTDSLLKYADTILRTAK